MRSYGTMNDSTGPHSDAGSDRPPSYDTSQQQQEARWQHAAPREQDRGGAYRWNVRGQQNDLRQQGRLIRRLFIAVSALFIAVFFLLIPVFRGPPQIHCYHDDYRNKNICCEDKDYNSHNKTCNAYPLPRCYYDYYRDRGICCEDKDYNSHTNTCKGYPPPRCYQDNYRYKRVCCDDKDYDSNRNFCRAYPPPHCYYDDYRRKQICCDDGDYDSSGNFCKGYPPSPQVNRKWFGKPPACAGYNCPDGSKLIMYSKFPYLAGKYDGCGSESETDLDTRLHACLGRWNAVCWSGRSVLCEAEVNPQNPFGFPK